MGTRAVIRFGDERIATHWDGYPEGLGKDLLKIGPDPTLEAVIKVGQGHNIDFATPAVVKVAAPDRYGKIAERVNKNLTEQGKEPKWTAESMQHLYEVEHREFSFGFTGPSDYNIGDFEGYGDFAEFEYTFKDGAWYVRPISGDYSEKGFGKTDDGFVLLEVPA